MTKVPAGVPSLSINPQVESLGLESFLEGPHSGAATHSFKTTGCSSAHLDGQILSAYIIGIGRAESDGQCLWARR